MATGWLVVVAHEARCVSMSRMRDELRAHFNRLCPGSRHEEMAPARRRVEDLVADRRLVLPPHPDDEGFEVGARQILALREANVVAAPGRALLA